nr:uncharacterized protein LOC129266497 [Lytechinus pictus]
MSMHITRKHANLTLQERHEYREIMLREKPVLKANGNKKIRKLLKCPLCPAITQRIDNHIVKIHGKKRGSKITKNLTAKARELEAQRAATSEQNKTLDEMDKDRIIDETEEHRTKFNMTKQFSTEVMDLKTFLKKTGWKRQKVCMLTLLTWRRELRRGQQG